MVTKRFFYVCAGLLCLALAHHLGARSTTAQASASIEAAACYDVPGIVYDVKVAVINRMVYELGGSGPRLAIAEPIPGAAKVIAVGIRGVILEDGEIWSHDTDTWELEGVFPNGGPTSTKHSTFGSVKARYR